MRKYLDRRTFLQQSTAGLATLTGARAFAAETPLKVAAVFTEFRYRSHAHVILENFFEPLLFNGQWTEPGVQVVSLHHDISTVTGEEIVIFTLAESAGYRETKKK